MSLNREKATFCGEGEDGINSCAWKVNGECAIAIIARNQIGNINEQFSAAKSEFVLDKLFDPRDGREYKTVKIGNQVWFAENLAFDYVGSKVYDNNLANLDKYGRLYTWKQAKEACPAGWHLPTNDEWDELLRFVDGDKGTKSLYDSETAGKYLKAMNGWNCHGGKSGNGINKFGFSALPGGYGYFDGSFCYVGNYGYWWSVSEDGSNDAYGRRMCYCDEYVEYLSGNKDCLYSIRCLKD
jgi:uncharacterized protein (TIGR02145 family)